MSTSSLAQAGELKDALYDTPEAAIRHFLAGIAKRDIAHSLQVSAANEIATKYDIKRVARRAGGVSLTRSPAPTEYEMYHALNRYSLLAEMSDSIRLFCFSLLVPDGDFSKPIRLPSEDATKQLVASVDPAALAKLKVIRIDLAHPDLNSKQAKEMAVELAGSYGATDSTERLVLLDLNGQKYYIGLHLLRYGKYWKIQWLSSFLAGVNAKAVKTTTEEYEAKLKG